MDVRYTIARKYPDAYVYMYLQGSTDSYDEDAAREQMIAMQDTDPELWNAAKDDGAFCCPPITTDREVVDDVMYIDLCENGCKQCWMNCRKDNMRTWLQPYLDESPHMRAYYERYYMRGDPLG